MFKSKNKKLYEKIKNKIYKKYPKHSAYKSGLLIQKYKKRGGTYKGKENKSSGLNRWFKEKWVNQRGEVKYKKTLIFINQI